MNRDINPLMTRTLEIFRATGKLPYLNPHPLDELETRRWMETIADDFSQANRRDNKPGDLDLREGHILESSPLRATQLVGDFSKGLMESHTFLPQEGQFSLINRAQLQSLDRLEIQWNQKVARFRAWHINRFKPSQNYQVGGRLEELAQLPPYRA